jgi:hypothetical protein
MTGTAEKLGRLCMEQLAGNGGGAVTGPSGAIVLARERASERPGERGMLTERHKMALE